VKHTYKPEFNRQACLKWLKKLRKSGYINLENRDLTLTTPFELIIPLSEAQKISASYKDNEETGGLIFCEMMSEKESLKLIVREHRPVPNEVERFFKNKSKKNSYYADPDLYHALLSENFSKADSGEILLPIHYHTHPTDDIKDDYRYLSTMSRLMLSEGDKHVSLERKIQLEDINLIYLNAILTGNWLEHRIISYGKGVSPLDFEETLNRQSAQGIIDATEAIESEGWRLAARLGLILATGVVGMNNPYHGKELLNSFSDYTNEKQYFSVISKTTDTRILFPKMLPDDARP
jgi:hypothetical protein